MIVEVTEVFPGNKVMLPSVTVMEALTVVVLTLKLFTVIEALANEMKLPMVTGVVAAIVKLH